MVLRWQMIRVPARALALAWSLDRMASVLRLSRAESICLETVLHTARAVTSECTAALLEFGSAADAAVVSAIGSAFLNAGRILAVVGIVFAVGMLARAVLTEIVQVISSHH